MYFINKIKKQADNTCSLYSILTFLFAIYNNSLSTFAANHCSN